MISEGREDCAAIPQEPTPKEEGKSRNQAGSLCGAAFDTCKIHCSDGEQAREGQDDPDSRVAPRASLLRTGGADCEEG